MSVSIFGWGCTWGPYIWGRRLIYGTSIFILNFAKLIIVSQDIDSVKTVCLGKM